MKLIRTLFLVGFACFTMQLVAQPEQGSVMIGGSAGFNAYSYGNYSSTEIWLAPKVGYFITDNIAVGALLDFTFYGGDDEGTYIEFGPYGRYYFNNSGSARFFGEVGVDIVSWDPGKNFDSSSNFGFNIGAGVDYFLNNWVALEGMLNFNSNKEKDADESATNFGLRIGVAAFFGGGGSK